MRFYVPGGPRLTGGVMRYFAEGRGWIERPGRAERPTFAEFKATYRRNLGAYKPMPLWRLLGYGGFMRSVGLNGRTRWRFSPYYLAFRLRVRVPNATGQFGRRAVGARWCWPWRWYELYYAARFGAWPTLNGRS